MEMRVEQGDYMQDERGFLARLEDEQAVLQRVLFRLRARRGQFPLMPEMGSELYHLPKEKPQARESFAHMCVVQALKQEDVQVQQVQVQQVQGAFAISVYLTWQGKDLHAQLSV